MIRRYLVALSVVVAASWALCGCARLAGPPDLPAAKLKVVAYMEGGGYQRDLRQALKPALGDLAALAPETAPRTAIVLDIDDTALSTYEYQKSMGFGHYTPVWHEWLRVPHGSAIVPVLEVFRAARAKGVAVFFVSGRRAAFRAATETSLRGAGYDDWTEIMLKPDGYKDASVGPFKTECRAQIEARGYRILLNIGDQAADLQGGHAVRSVKLPNPIYVSP